MGGHPGPSCDEAGELIEDCRESTTPPHIQQSLFDDDTPLACGMEDPDICESCM